MPISVPVPTASQPSDAFSLGDALNTILSQWKWMLAIIVAAFTVTLLYALTATPIFQADTLIQVEEKKGSTPAGLQQIASALDVSQSPVSGEIEIIKSREVLGRAIDVLHLNIDSTPEHRVPYFWSRAQAKRTPLAKEAPFGLQSLAWGGEEAEVTQFEVPPSYEGRDFHLVVTKVGEWTLEDPDGAFLAKGTSGQGTQFRIGGSQGTISVGTLTARIGE